MDGGNESHESAINSVLLDRLRSLEESHVKLKEQFNFLLQEKSVAESTICRDVVKKARNMQEDSGGTPAVDSSWAYIPGAYFSGSPYKNVLGCMGHAVHISRAGSGEIIYWNSSAEKLYGYKVHEALGQRDPALIIDEKHHVLVQRIAERLSFGQSWAGQLPLRNRSGQIFMAIVSKSPIYEGGELVGIITVSSDAAVFNNQWLENVRMGQNPADDRCRERGVNLKRIQWCARPQFASSVYNLASKVLLRKHEDSESGGSSSIEEKEQNEPGISYLKSERPPRAPATRPRDNSKFPNGKSRIDGDSTEIEEYTSEFPQPFKLAGKVLVKLHNGGTVSPRKGKDVTNEPASPGASQETSSYKRVIDENKDEELVLRDDSSAGKGTSERSQAIGSEVTEDSYVVTSSRNECAEVSRVSEQVQMINLQVLNPDVQNSKTMEVEDSLQLQPHIQELPTSRDDTGSSHGSSSSKGDNGSNSIVHCEIHWEDIQLREEIGQGSFAVVYRGIWNGSDVAVKVYSGNEYKEETLLGYNKELDIMRRLRHPNVLLFIGAVCSQEKLALVTEFLPRGSLFKALHKSNQQLDIRRRLRMALDVARGMNYLHHRNPPIVHRDLKSSNLFVDKSWTVKVGDFGLSKLKNATFLITKSVKGAPQWMAPEVLRNEPSTEKSDTYSFGVILWELMTECIPWKNLNSSQVVGLVGFMDRRLDLPENLDPKISSIIHDCWHSKPENRPSFQDLIRRMTELMYTATGVNARKSSGGLEVLQKASES